MIKENEENQENTENPQEEKNIPETDSGTQESSEQKQSIVKNESLEDASDAKEDKSEDLVQEVPKEKKEVASKGPETKMESVSKEKEIKTEAESASKEKETKTEAAAPEAPEFIEKVISINRITKVTKGGKKLSFSALVVVGDMRGNVGYSLEKAAEVAIAIRKAMGTAKKNMIKIPMKGTTIPHEIIGRCSGSRVLLKPASDGTGVIASGPVRAVCDGAGIHNILTKCHRSNNPINVVKATLDGLSRLKINSFINE